MIPFSWLHDGSGTQRSSPKPRTLSTQLPIVGQSGLLGHVKDCYTAALMVSKRATHLTTSGWFA